MESLTVTTGDGVHLHVEDSGGDGRPVVLVPGFTADTTSWVFQTDALVAAGHRVVVVDRRSHGRSDAPTFGHRMARHGMDLHEVVDQLALRDVVLVGASMGASTIWAYLDLVGEGAVSAVVSVDQTPRMRSGDDWAFGFYGLDDTNVGTFFDNGIPDTGHGPAPERTQAAFEQWFSRLGGMPEALGSVRPETMPLLRDHAVADWRDVVARTTVPVIVVAGRESQFWPAEHAQATAALAKDGRAVVLEDCGHVVALDQPDTLNHLLLDLVGGLSPGRP